MVKSMLLWRKDEDRGKRLSEEDHCRVELFMWHLGCKINTSKWPHLIGIVFLVKTCLFYVQFLCVYISMIYSRVFFPAALLHQQVIVYVVIYHFNAEE